MLLLQDGSIFYGMGLGAETHQDGKMLSFSSADIEDKQAYSALGEICFNTAMSGYQEIMSDPSYAGQIIVFTFPHIGNVGVNSEDIESKALHLSGVVFRENITEPSNWRSQEPLHDWLSKNNVTGIAGVDTRALTRLIRKKGFQNAIIAYNKNGVNNINISELKKTLSAHPTLEGAELASKVCSIDNHNVWQEQIWDKNAFAAAKNYHLSQNNHQNNPKRKVKIIAIDYGQKHNIARCLKSLDAEIVVVPALTPADEILAHNPDGIFLSNGPGDPKATAEYAVPIIKELLTSHIPIFGICLGHQLLALALGAKTEKMFQGHRGANHPILNINNGTVEITSHNHGFVVNRNSLPDGVEETHKSLFDGTIQGLRVKDRPVFSVQYHPEASPGPHDSYYLFHEFYKNILEHQK